MNKNQLSEALVTSISESGLRQLDDLKLHFIPAACYAYTVGMNTIQQTRKSYGL